MHPCTFHDYICPLSVDLVDFVSLSITENIKPDFMFCHWWTGMCHCSLDGILFLCLRSVGNTSTSWQMGNPRKHSHTCMRVHVHTHRRTHTALIHQSYSIWLGYPHDSLAPVIVVETSPVNRTRAIFDFSLQKHFDTYIITTNQLRNCMWTIAVLQSHTGILNYILYKHYKAGPISSK